MPETRQGVTRTAVSRDRGSANRSIPDAVRRLAALALLGVCGSAALAGLALGAASPATAAPSDSPVPAASGPADATASSGATASSDATAPADVTPTDPGPTGSAPTPPGDTTPPPTATPPTLSAPTAGYVSPGAVSVRGQGEPGASLIVSSGGVVLCSTTVDGDGAWSCEVDGLTSSPSTTLIVTQDDGVSGDGQTQTASVTIAVLTPPTVSGGPRGPLTNGALRGTAYPGAVVTAAADGATCQGVADGSGAWSCPLSGLADGPHSVRAWQETPWSAGASPESAAVAITLDATAPAAPALLSPEAGAGLPASGAVFSGTGEDGSAVSVFADAYVLCQAPVVDGSWSCPASEVPAGTYRVVVLQQDAAGNVSVQSSPIELAFGTAAGTTPATPGGAAPGAPTDPAAPSPTDAASPPSTSAPAPGDSTPSAPGAPGTPSGPDGLERSQGTWADATQFTTALSPLIGAGSASTWLVALIAGGFVVAVVALPARLLAGTLGTFDRDGDGRRARLAARLTGRNRSRYEFERAPDVSLSPLVVGAGALLASAAVSVLSVPVLGQPAYLRLFLAAATALAIVNAAATVPAAVAGRRMLGAAVTIRLAPALLLVSAAGAVLSRLAGLDPALVFGLVVALAVPVATGAADRGRLAVAQLVPLLALGACAWIAQSLTPLPEGAAGAWLTEVLTVTALACFGTASALSLPLGASPGRALLRWSPAMWVGLAVVSFGGLSALLLPAVAGSGRMWIPIVVGVGFAAVSVSVWAWQRYVAPVLGSDGDE
ncbi:Ig-like domain-containing protein [Cnuibacter physcomitrellae]|uniref:Ig-like domain-containing protein n=1 Tax=Cnuibacter physcomitrellae TaxID=1619308 RepID=UPI002175EAC7|nr:Ig-like domain-containing protein [Cnuibacter physcomitrellae]MCS5496517.1 Ig-like domain-containing protein [Cnuibacter physcomitrellae]